MIDLTRDSAKLSSVKLLFISSVMVISVSSASVITKLINASPSVIAFWRLFIALLIMATYYLVFDRGVFDELRDKSKYVITASVVSGVFLALHFYTWISSLKLTKVYISTTLVCLHPLITTLLSSIILKELLKASAIVGILLTVLGSSIVSYSATSNNGDVDVYGALLALIGAFLASAYIVTGRYVRVRVSKLGSYVLPTYTASTLTLLLITLIECNPVAAINLNEAPWLILLALGPMIGGHTLLNYMLRYVNASIASVPIVLEPVGASILASLILSESLTQVSYLGIILTVVGLIMVTLTPSHRK